MADPLSRPMRAFFRVALVHLAITLAAVFTLRDQPLVFLGNMARTPLFHLNLVLRFLPVLLPLLVIALWLNRHRLNRDFLSALGLALAGGAILAFSFAAFKTTMPLILPYWADPPLAAIDRALHLGTDPWRLAYALLPAMPPGLARLIYYDLWFVPAFFFPAFLVLLDGNAQRVGRFVAIWTLVWIVLGNIVALAGLSAGPVYYQRITGDDAFAGLRQAMQATGLTEAAIGRLQEAMWSYLENGRQMQGAGISAFPSVHVGIAAVLAAYALERFRLFGLIVAAYAAAILFLSVWLGWHYAIDGYASILFVAALWRLKVTLPGARPRHAADGASGPQTAPPADAAPQRRN